MNFLSRWRPIHLTLAWIAYWVVLVGATLGRAVPAMLSATRAQGNHGEISASFSSTLSLTVKEMGQVTWTGSVQFLTAALWLAVPPLILWLLWLRARSGVVRSEPRPVRL